MDKIIFVDYETRICSGWLNTVSDTVWDALGQAKTPLEARQFIGAVEEAPNDGKPYLRASLGWQQADTSLAHNDLGGRSVSDAHPTSAITGLDSALAGKAPLSHTHTGSEISGIIATEVSFSPAGTIVATNVQAAISELDNETQGQITNIEADIVALNTEKASVALAVPRDSTTGAAQLPVGTTAQRPTGVEGQFRYNADLDVFEGFSNGAWGQVGGGQMYGQAATKAIFYNANTIGENLTVKAGQNGGTFGPVTVNDGFTVTVEAGSVWTIC